MKVGSGGVGALVAYYDGLARERAGPERGPVGYYVDPDEPPGRWWGAGCDAVGLAGEVAPGELANMLQALHPLAGERLGRGMLEG